MARKSRYQPLVDHLASFEGVEWRPSFAEIEQLLGKPLPKIARRKEAWWEDADAALAVLLAPVGWQVERVELDEARVTFRRRPPDAPPETPELDTGRRIPISAWAVLGGLLLTVAAVAAGGLVKKRRRSWNS